MTAVVKRRSQRAYERLVLDLLPKQGDWTDEQYLWLTDHTNRLVEFTHGFLEPLPMPTDKHQSALQYVFLLFHAFVQPRGGKVHFCGLRVRLRSRKYREPDLVLLLDASDPRRQNRFWLGADLVAEVVSPDNPARDLILKKSDYAQAGIPEYWIVNPLNETIIVHRLQGRRYVRHGLFRRGQKATSVLPSGFAVDVDAAFDAR
jgi:Uma2 family endonuclease